MPGRQIKRIPKAELEKREQHPLYYAFANMKSATLEVARQIAKDSKENLSSDVQRFLDEFDKKAA